MRRFLSARRARVAVVVAVAAAIGTASAAYGSGSTGSTAKSNVASSAAATVPSAVGIRGGIASARKALCKKSNYKIGYDNYSETQEFEAAVNKNTVDLAKALGCVTLINLTDNGDGPTAVANVQTMITEGIQGLDNGQLSATSQTAIDKLVKKAGIPQVTSAVVGTGYTYITVEHYPAGFALGQALGQAALKRYPADKQPYLLDGVFETGGPTQLQQGYGTTAGLKKYFPNLPNSHVVTIPEDATGPTTYTNTLSALSAVPANALVLMTSTDSDSTNGMFQAAIARKRTKFLVEDSSGANLALQNVCKYNQYVGAIDFEANTWGNWVLPAVIELINGVKLPLTIGIPTKAITKANDPLCH